MECLRCGRLPGNSHTEICALQGEIERLRHDIERHIRIASELATENERLRAENKAAWDSAEYNAQRARVAEAAIGKLREYARHKPGCYWRTGSIKQPQPCDCGYAELMKELEETK